ncbi:hypothetical protein [Mesorhizobium sp. L-2-11]|uniref:hypothetical protein n=1 Tax=Mesorhizobium sp. L-2-11 TaxID=2744521 RepID=UPI0019287611|nr:hypothetical protein [Mesorhizobium sp. L-2-11]
MASGAQAPFGRASCFDRPALPGIWRKKLAAALALSATLGIGEIFDDGVLLPVHGERWRQADEGQRDACKMVGTAAPSDKIAEHKRDFVA